MLQWQQFRYLYLISKRRPEIGFVVLIFKVPNPSQRGTFVVNDSLRQAYQIVKTLLNKFFTSPLGGLEGVKFSVINI